MAQDTSTASGAADFTDVQYLEQMANHYASSPVPEIRAHQKRLRAIAAALASAAAPAQQPNTAYAALPAECDSPELCAVSRSCAGQFGTKRICASRGQDPAGAAPDEQMPILRWIMKTADAAKEPCGDDPESPSAVRNATLAAIAGAAAQALGLVRGPSYEYTAPSVLEDAARYRWLAAHCRRTSEHWGGRWSIVVDGPAPKSHDSEDDLDAAIDAARKQGANHD